MARHPKYAAAEYIEIRTAAGFPPSSILQSAASEPDAYDALRLLRAMLMLPTAGDTDSLVDAHAWRRQSYQQHLTVLADWLRAEIFAEVEKSERLVPCARPMQTVGTND